MFSACNTPAVIKAHTHRHAHTHTHTHHRIKDRVAAAVVIVVFVEFFILTMAPSPIRVVVAAVVVVVVHVNGGGMNKTMQIRSPIMQFYGIHKTRKSQKIVTESDKDYIQHDWPPYEVLNRSHNKHLQKSVRNLPSAGQHHEHAAL